MLRHLVPEQIRTPFARYSHGVEIPVGSRLLVCSGQLGIAADDAIPDGAEAQSKLCFEAIRALLREAGMDVSDIVRLNAYVTAREHMAGYMAARDAFIGTPPPASTLMIVCGFTREEFVVEIEALAAKVA
ncbi:enamine deaminase RidA (YjgF/YER057c/UK114 family) [Breoghania corrubedonensis]|uniref:Enamine deaminase RidA (YjgF/YER057c/UK114 family) n=1 Tax=Breoghania corrubedonensis TaxID=665038 RepID=A0A2T5VHP0_9HYPH|nr:RidA family protein [Breoghania corrubedonensis]PTW63277.1 enamine deaminase RidA (YjgF/YER057c/UK114 family) [Breoghania corrubedonensis]